MLKVNFSPFPNINTERLKLRRMFQSDAKSFFKLRSDKNIMQHIGRPIATKVDDAMQLINIIDETLVKRNGITWAIALKEKRDLVGTIGLWRIEKENYRAEIGYLLDTDLQGKGLMQEAMVAVIEYGFEKMKLHSIEAVVSPKNIASIKLLEKNKFVKEAHFKENYFFNGEFLDSFVYSLVGGK